MEEVEVRGEETGDIGEGGGEAGEGREGEAEQRLEICR